MAKLFRLALPEGVSSVKLDSQGRATVQYTIKNVSQRPIDGRALLISLPQVQPPSGPVEKGWVKIDGKIDRHFDVDREETFTVKILVPPKSAPGSYSFRLDTVWVEQTDQGDQGPTVSFAIAAAAAQSPSSFPLWLIPVLLVVVAGLGVGIWLALRNSGPKTPEVTEAPVTEKPVKDAAPPPAVKPDSGKPAVPDKVVAQGPAARARVQIMNAHSSLCLSPAGGGKDKNNQIVQYLCDQDPARFWSITVVSGDIVEITNLNSGLCLTIAGGSADRNIVSVQYTCDGDPSRRWHYKVVDSNTLRLVNLHSDLCLTIAGGGSDRNTPAVQYPCDGDRSRDWQIIGP
jgi:cytolethal distending toxin subunit A